MTFCNTTLSDEKIKEDPIFHSLTFHHLGLILSAVFGLIAVVISFFLIIRHATHYLKPWEQKHIIRILFMIPIYATVSFLSYLYYQHAIYFEVLRDCYEAFAIASFFTLLCHYIAPNLHDQKVYFRSLEAKNWIWPLTWMQKCTGGQSKGILRKPQSGLTWFNIIWIGVFQYCFIRVFFTVVSVLTQATDRYCEASLSPAFAHVWVMVFEGASVSVAMYCLIQFYFQLRGDLAPYRPFLKILCIKLVIFFSFWQTTIISFLSSSNGPLKESKKISYPDIKVGIPAMLICIEMAIFATMHIFAFPWKPYDLSRNQDPINAPHDGFSGPTPTKYVHGPARAFVSAFNPWDIVKASARGFRWLFVGSRHRKSDPSYQTKLGSMPPATGYTGPTFAGNNEPAIAYSEGKKPGGKSGFEDSDTQGLLSHAQANANGRQNPYYNDPHAGSLPDDASDLASSYNDDHLPTAPLPPGYHTAGQLREQEYGVDRRGRPGEFEPQDTSYHGGGVSPARRPQVPEQDLGRPSTEWDMFAGANRPGPGAGRGGAGGAPPGML